MPDRLITLSIGRDEAVILFDMLAEFSTQATLPIRDEADRIALFRLHGAIESTFAELPQATYQKLLNTARLHLAQQSTN